MAKRFIDTGLFDDEWFAELRSEAKIFWVYYLTKCDHAGLLKFNKKLIEFQTGIKSLDTVLKELGNRLVRVNEQLFFCPKFIRFQYPNFPKSNVAQQASAIELLIKNGLWDSETNNFNSSITLTEDLPKTYGNGNGNGNNKKESKKKIENPFIGELAESWNEWVQHRAELRKPITPTAAQKQIKFLSARPPNEAKAILDKAIEKNWQGLYELEKQHGKRNTNQTNVRRADATVEPGRPFGEL